MYFVLKEIKYLNIVEDIKKKIISGDFSSDKFFPSENELKSQYGVSRYTIRKALEILENQDYIYAKHGVGRFLSKKAVYKKRFKKIAVIITYISDYIFPRIISGIDSVLSENQCQLILKNTLNYRKREMEYLNEIFEDNIDGVIIEPSKSQMYCNHIELYNKLEKYNIPYVFIQGRYKQLPKAPYIILDDFKGISDLTKYLINTNHKKILGIFKADDYQGQQRHKGYAKTLQRFGILYDPDLIIWYTTEDQKKQPYDEIERLFSQHNDIDGIICYNDQIAINTIEFLNGKNISVPDDISVTGFDYSEIGQKYRIKLTTVTHPLEKLGETAAKILLDIIEGKILNKKQIVITPELIIGKSTKNRL